MAARVQDVQLITHQDQFCFGFSVWDQDNKLTLTVGFATKGEAIQAADQAKAIFENAVLVVRHR